MKVIIPGALSLVSGLASAQVFLLNSTSSETVYPVAIEIPETLSPACAAPLNETVKCTAALAAIAFDGYFPTVEDLEAVCIADCFSSLQDLREEQLNACNSSDVVVTGGIAYPPTFTVDQLMFTYNYTCLQDESGAYCAPQIESWLNTTSGMTAEQNCSSCFLRTLQTELNSFFAYDQELAEEFDALTASCGVRNYPVTSPSGYTVTAPASGTSTSPGAPAAPTANCVEEYVIQDGDTCKSISVAKNVSTHELLYTNQLAAHCAAFPAAGESLCIPKSCAIHTVQENETCYSIVEMHSYSFTVTQLISWNANINRDCTNLDQLVSSQICISSPDGGNPASTGAATTTLAAIPTDVATGTNTECAKYYLVSAGDDCSRVTVMMGISLADFYFLNPEVNSTNCNNLMAGYSYCVQAVGNINTYSGYGGTSTRKCIVDGSIAASCLATTSVATDTYWSFPAPTNVTITSSTPTASSSYVVTTTPLPLASGTAANCAGYEVFMSSDSNTTTDGLNTCDFISWYTGLSVDDLLALNPSLTYNSSNPSSCVLEPGYRYCISASSNTTSTSTSTTTATTTPTPTQTGMVSSCTEFYYVVAGDGCYDLAAGYGIALNDFYSWNPALGDDCSGLQANVYVCVGVTSTASTTTISTSTPSTGNGVTTPTPIQKGMTDKCDSFYLVLPGDGCWAIADGYSIDLTDFYAWNPAVGSDCSTLQPDYYVCIGVNSPATTSTTVPSVTTTSGSNGVATPSPVQDGIIASCGTFYFVQAGDGCWAIANKYAIQLTDFYSWNPAVGDDCSGLQANVYVCIGLMI